MLKDLLLRIIKPGLFLNDEQYRQFLSLVNSGKITKETNPTKHCCVFFIPFNSQTKEILLLIIKRRGNGLFPGAI